MSELPDSLRRGWCPGALRPMQSGDGLIVRLKPSCGILSLDQADAIATLAATYGNGIIELTSRGNLQLRGVRDDTLTALTTALDALALLDPTPEAEAIRNIISSPLAGIDPATYDTRSVVMDLERALAAAPDLSPLSDKFGFSIDGGGHLPLDGVEADIRFTWCGDAFAISLARDEGAVVIGTSAPDDVARTALALARSFLTHAGAARRMRLVSNDTLHRIAETVTPPSACTLAFANSPIPPPTSSPGLSRGPSLQQLASAIVARSTTTSNLRTSGSLAPRDKPEDDRGEGRRATANAGDDASVQAPAWPNPIGTIVSDTEGSVAGVGLPYGTATAAALRGFVAAAHDASATELRLTPWRAILMHTPNPAVADRLIAQATTLGFITDPADPRRAIAACPGAPACANGSTSVRDDADRFAAALSSILVSGTTLHVSGCVKGCARRGPADLTLVAESGRYGLVVNGPASAAACGRFTPQQAAETLARVASAMTKAGDAPNREAAIAAALKEIQAA